LRLPRNGKAALALNASVDVINSDLQTFPLLPVGRPAGVFQHRQSGADFAFWWMERPLEDSEKF